MSFQKCFIIFSTLALFSFPSLHAASLVYSNGDVVAIDGLVVDGAEYNVTFDASVPDLSTFINNENGANDAVDAINVLFNQANVDFVSDPPYSSQFFEVSYALPTPGANDVILGNDTTQWINQGPLQSYPYADFDNDYAHFALAPEPSVGQLVLFAGLALVPYGIKRFRRRSPAP